MTTAPGAVNRWVLAARPRTLPAAIVPVGVGAALVRPETINWVNTALAAAVALLLQIGTNYANDYSDGVRGTDHGRVGPLRLVASGAADARTVKLAAFACFGVAGACGLVLAAVSSWWLVAVGVACVAAGWLYTGGPKPYGYLGLGELFVFVFFGVVATAGSAYVQSGTFALWWASVPVGLLATALLEANNLRDVAGDQAAGKRTLAVRVGPLWARWLYVGSIVAAGAGVVGVGLVRPWALLALVALVLAVRPAMTVLDGADGRELLPVLAATARVQVVAGVLLALGILL